MRWSHELIESEGFDSSFRRTLHVWRPGHGRSYTVRIDGAEIDQLSWWDDEAVIACAEYADCAPMQGPLHWMEVDELADWLENSDEAREARRKDWEALMRITEVA